MKILNQFLHLFRRRKLDAEMGDEMRLHGELQTERNIAAGMSLEDARYAALRQFGNVASIQERAREGRGWLWLEQGWQDVHYGVRALRRNPGFTAAAMLTLALGIGANAAVFSLMHHLLLASLPVRAPEQLVVIERQNPLRPEGSGFPYLFFHRLGMETNVFAGVLGRSRGIERVTVGTELGGEAALGELVSGNYFDVLGVQPYLGRLLSVTDDVTPGGHPVVVLSHRYWLRRFQGDASVVGTTIRLTGQPMTVIGVSPPGFNGIDPSQEVDLRVPLAMQAELRGGRSNPNQRGAADLQLVGRLAAAVGIKQAEAVTAAKWRQFLDAETPVTGQNRQILAAERVELRGAATGYGQTRQQFQPTLGALMTITAAVLLVACLNLASLLLARSAARRHEFALRLALGAGQGRLLRQLLVEGLLLALGGALLGGLLAMPGSRVLWLIMSGKGAALDLPAGPNAAMLLGLAATATLCGVIFGLAPAWQVRRTALTPGLKSDQRGGGAMRGRNLLVCAQVAASVIVLTGAGLFLQTVHALRNTSPGFEVRQLLLVALSPKNAGRTEAEAQTFFREVRERVGVLPGVTGVTYSMVRALTGADTPAAVAIEGVSLPENAPLPSRNVVGPDYFRTFGIPLSDGRDFTAGDDVGAPKVAIVNEKFAQLYFPGQNPLGRKIGPKAPEYTIVGVAKDVRQANLREPEAPRWYIAYGQFPASKYLDLCVRTTGEPEAMRQMIQVAIAAVDPGVAMFEVRTQEAQLAQLFATERTLATLASFFGVIVALLAVVGLYGLLAYFVAQQRREFGIRLALGAQPGRVLRAVLRHGLRLAIIGTAIGVPMALGMTRLMSNLLFGVSAADPVTLGIVVLLVLGGSAAACWLPARRASKVDPMVALRAE
jgi:predicted permease